MSSSPNPVRGEGESGQVHTVKALADAMAAIFLEARGSRIRWDMRTDMVTLRDLMAQSSFDEVLERWRYGLGAEGYLSISNAKDLQRKWNDLSVVTAPSRKGSDADDGMMISTNAVTIHEAIWHEAPTWLGLPAGSEEDSWQLTTVARELAWGIPSNLPRILRAMRAPAECIARAEERAAAQPASEVQP